MTAYKFTRNELKHLNVYAPSTYNPQKFGNEPWLDALVYLAYKNNKKELLYSLNGDSTTCGDNAGANVLVLVKDLESWSLAAQEVGAELAESDLPIKGGRYGDDMASIDLAQSNDTFYWINEGISPAVAAAKFAVSKMSDRGETNDRHH